DARVLPEPDAVPVARPERQQHVPLGSRVRRCERDRVGRTLDLDVQAEGAVRVLAEPEPLHGTLLAEAIDVFEAGRRERAPEGLVVARGTRTERERLGARRRA